MHDVKEALILKYSPNKHEIKKWMEFALAYNCWALSICILLSIIHIYSENIQLFLEFLFSLEFEHFRIIAFILTLASILPLHFIAQKEKQYGYYRGKKILWNGILPEIQMVFIHAKTYRENTRIRK